MTNERAAGDDSVDRLKQSRLRQRRDGQRVFPLHGRHRFRHFPVAADATVKQIDAVAAAARELRRVRAEAFELPGANPLKDAHASLDTAVLTAHGFNAKKDLFAQLLALNLEAVARIEHGEPVTASRRAQNYPDAKELVADDCIRPT